MAITLSGCSGFQEPIPGEQMKKRRRKRYRGNIVSFNVLTGTTHGSNVGNSNQCNHKRRFRRDACNCDGKRMDPLGTLASRDFRDSITFQNIY